MSAFHCTDKVNVHAKTVYHERTESAVSYHCFPFCAVSFFLFSYQGPVGPMGARGEPGFEGPMVSCI